MNQDPIVNIEVCGCYNINIEVCDCYNMNIEVCVYNNINSALVVVDLFKDMMDVVVYYSHSIMRFFCGRRQEFLVVVQVYDAWNKVVEISPSGEFISTGCCSIVGKFCER